MARAAATTRFLLGRRGRNLYPIRNPKESAETNSTTGSGTSSTPTHAGRHGVPAPKQGGWNCSTKKQQAYAYGFPMGPPTHAKSWLNSPVVLVTLLLLSACFVGAYCLVLRIDKSLQDTLKPRNGSGSKFPTANARGSPSSNTKALSFHEKNPSLSQLLPLYLNVTTLYINCDELTVEVTQSNSSSHNSEKTDRLIFKDIISTAFQSDGPLADSPDRKQREQTDHRRLEGDGTERSVAKSAEDGDQLDNQDRTIGASGGEDEPQEQANIDEQGTSDGVVKEALGCQVHGHLWLPIRSGEVKQHRQQQQQPAVVSFKSRSNKHHNLSHRIDQLKVGSIKSFPKEEPLFLRYKFHPHTYTEQDEGDSLVAHEYQIYDNFSLHLVHDEQQASNNKNNQDVFSQGEVPEIKLIFSPTSMVQ